MAVNEAAKFGMTKLARTLLEPGAGEFGHFVHLPLVRSV